jgi:4-hydroxy-tetrahydrodipicolinate synthase
MIGPAGRRFKVQHRFGRESRMSGGVGWAGIYPAALTMFDARGRLDEEATAEHLDRLVRDGAHGIVAAGTSGEFVALDDAERRRLIAVAVRAVAGRVPVIAGTGTASTPGTIALTREAADLGADGAIVILPYYQRPTLAEVVEHLRAVGAASPLPVMVYNNPANSGAPPLDASDLAALHRDGLAAGVKSTFPTVHQVHEARALTDERFRVFYGSFMAPLEGMAGGAHGWISGILNVVTRDAVELWEAVGASDLERAGRAWARILPIKLLWTRQQLGATGDLVIYRAILRLRGQVAGFSRRPLLELTPEQVGRLEGILGPLGLLEPEPVAR